MRVIIQRVQTASVTINQAVFSSIDKGLLVLAGFEDNDEKEDIDWTAAKISSMRLFTDTEEKMNLSLNDVNGDLLVVSQFTLHASTKKGNRPSFIRAAKPQKAIPLYNSFCKQLETITGKAIKTGQFGADMKVTLVNDGPVTIFIDSRQRE